MARDLPPPTARHALGSLLLAAIPLVWLMPQHLLPWLTAQQDFVTLVLLVLAGLSVRDRLPLPRAWALAVAIALASVAVQATTDRLFLGDAAMVALYLLALIGAIAVGGVLADGLGPPVARWSGADLFALSVAGSALLCVAIALMQWTDTRALPLPVVTLLPGDRPYANFAQANHFASACFLGVAALGWLRESRLLGAAGWWAGSTFLVLGMAASGSRTPLLQLVSAALLLAVLRFRAREGAARPCIRAAHVALLAVALAGMMAVRPAVNELVAPPPVPGSGMDASTQAGTVVRAGELRGPLWLALADAVRLEPLAGWGWLRTQSAQFAVALDHPPLGRYFEHGHNLVLDLFVWAGIPVAVSLLLLAAWSLGRQAAGLRSAADPRPAWIALAGAGLLVHALLEYPHAYAYFLVPAGLGIGLLHRLAPEQREWRARLSAQRLGWLALAALLAAVAVDYVQVDHHYRTVRLEARFGSGQVRTPPPELRLLTQMDAYLRFIHTEAQPGMDAREVEAMLEVARRFGHPPVLLRLALAQGLNGEPDAAAATLRRLCAMHTAAHCAEGRESWIALQARYPSLQGVPAP